MKLKVSYFMKISKEYPFLSESSCYATSPKNYVSVGFHERNLKTFFFAFKKKAIGTFLVVQWLKLHDPNARGPYSVPGQGTRP